MCSVGEEDTAGRLDTENSVEQLREQPFPDMLGDYQDVLLELHRSVAEQTGIIYATKSNIFT